MACRAAARASAGPPSPCFGAAALLDLRAKAGGGRRTRTFEVIRRLIYSQLPLPLGTLPRSTASEPARRNGGDRPRMTLKPGTDGGLPVGRFMGETHPQSQPMPSAGARFDAIETGLWIADL